MRAIELFAGAGGLGLGLSQAGFDHEIAVDRDTDAVATLRHNQRSGHPLLRGWKIEEADVRRLDYSAFTPEPDLLAGGPPCQPYSIGGKNAGQADERDGFPYAVAAVRSLRPRAYLWENVSNLSGPSHKAYFELLLLQFQHPEVMRADDESNEQFAARLRRHAAQQPKTDLHYRVGHVVLDAADMGTAQRRSRVMIVGLRSDVTADWSAPTPTHGADELFQAQWVTGRYWEERGLPRPTEIPEKVQRLLANLQRNQRADDLFATPTPRKLAHRTVHDAICDLPEPGRRDPQGIQGHIRPPREARAYRGHTGSPVHMPAKALRAGDHGVSGGENMIDWGTGEYRHYTTREAARLQGFPDDIHFECGWSDSIRLLGNAVPLELSRAVGLSIHAALDA